MVDAGFRVVTFNGDEILADPEGSVDRLVDVVADMADDVLIDAGHAQPTKRKLERRAAEG